MVISECVCGQDSYLILDTLPAEYDSRVKAMEVDEKPSEDYSDVGGLDKQIQELVEAIVLPVTHKACFQGLGLGFGVDKQIQELVEGGLRAACHAHGMPSGSRAQDWNGQADAGAGRPSCCLSCIRHAFWV